MSSKVEHLIEVYIFRIIYFSMKGIIFPARKAFYKLHKFYGG